MTQKIVLSQVFIILFSFFIACEDRTKKKNKNYRKKTSEIDSKLETSNSFIKM